MAGSASVHVTPLNIQVSSSCPPPAPLPLNNTTSPASGPVVSVVTGAEFLAGGEVAGLSSAQSVPSKIHVSSKKVLLPCVPPKSTTSPASGPEVKVAIDTRFRAEGEVAGATSVHVVPSKIQVSPRKPLLP